MRSWPRLAALGVVRPNLWTTPSTAGLGQGTRPQAWVLGAAVLVHLACSAEAPDAAPEVHYGGEECGYCRMIISEARFTAALIDEAGGTTVFDDVGCLINHLQRNPNAGGTLLVHDYAGDEWLAVEEAAFVRHPRGLTPMGSGILAFSSPAAAAALTREWDAEVVGWASLVAESAPEPRP